jgi:anthranilate 1,2-dioxygenase ferredoxin subunit
MHTFVQWHEVGIAAELPELSVQRVGTTGILIVNHDPPRASTPLCPHKFAPLEEGHLEDGCLHCPVHDAAFKLESGEPRDGDGWAGELDMYPAKLEDGKIWVQID